MSLLEEIADGRTDMVFDYVGEGHPATSTDQHGVSLIQHCAYYGDVSAMKFLLAHGASLDSLGDNLGLIVACFHGHWRLVKFLIERGADPNRPEAENGESPLHAALCKANNPKHTLIVKILLAHGANPNCATKPGVETGGFMRDVRTKGETPLHRAAAFADEEAIQALIEAGAVVDAKDVNGDSPLTWASWHLRSASALRKLCYGPYRIRPDYAGMDANLRGKPHL
jgi:ankyrin repeat protein